jgi:hypothetical protein
MSTLFLSNAMGTNLAYVNGKINCTVPSGATGPTGPAGLQGPPAAVTGFAGFGAAGLLQVDANGKPIGVISASGAGTTGPTGSTGPQGPTGPAGATNSGVSSLSGLAALIPGFNTGPMTSGQTVEYIFSPPVALTVNQFNVSSFTTGASFTFTCNVNGGSAISCNNNSTNVTSANSTATSTYSAYTFTPIAMNPYDVLFIYITYAAGTNANNFFLIGATYT